MPVTTRAAALRSQANGDLIHLQDVLFADGTFKVSPKLFEQLYVIHVMENGEGINFIFLSN